jgi:hypothetical protein
VEEKGIDKKITAREIGAIPLDPPENLQDVLVAGNGVEQVIDTPSPGQHHQKGHPRQRALRHLAQWRR